MSLDLRRRLYILSVVGQIKSPILRKAVLNEFLRDDSVFNAIREIAINTLEGKVPINKRKLRGCRQGLECVAKATKRTRRRAVSKLKGGFWSYLVPVVFDLLRQAVTK